MPPLKTIQSSLLLLSLAMAPMPALSEELSAFEKQLRLDAGIETRESVEIHNGVRYRKIEIKGDVYYLKFAQRNEEIGDIECGKPKGFSSNHLVEASVTVYKRTKVFIQALKESCVIEEGNPRKKLEIAAELGIALPEKPTDAVKDKKILIDPLNLNSVGFSGSF